MKANKKIARFVDTLDRISQKGYNVPGLIMSSPGYGKTSTIEMYCKVRDYNLTTLIASQYAPDDILGLQAVDDGQLRRLTPSWFNDLLEQSRNGKRNILFIDEITTCDEFIQAPLMNLIFTRKLTNNVSLPSNTTIIAAGNFSEELNNAFKLSSPIVNRFMILNLRPEDYNFREVYQGTFSHAKDYEEYLGLTENEQIWDPSRIAVFLQNNVTNKERVIKVSNSAKSGLLGFISIRSVDYSLKYIFMYCSHYSGPDWMYVVGDTLGLLDGIPITSYLTRNSARFKKESRDGVSALSIREMVEKFNSAFPGEEKSSLEGALRASMKFPEDLTSEDIEYLGKVNDPGLRDAFNDMIQRMS